MWWNSVLPWGLNKHPLCAIGYVCQHLGTDCQWMSCSSSLVTVEESELSSFAACFSCWWEFCLPDSSLPGSFDFILFGKQSDVWHERCISLWSDYSFFPRHNVTFAADWALDIKHRSVSQGIKRRGTTQRSCRWCYAFKGARHRKRQWLILRDGRIICVKEPRMYSTLRVQCV